MVGRSSALDLPDGDPTRQPTMADDGTGPGHLTESVRIVVVSRFICFMISNLA
jgi:hypothetical protein